jgi:hypothetical protein
LAATVPLNRVGRPEEIAETIMFSRPTRRRSSRVRRTSSTAARRLGDFPQAELSPPGGLRAFNFISMTKERTTMNTHQTAPTQFIEAAQRQQKGETET